MKKVTYLVCCVGLALQSCQSGQVKNENPFFNTYETPHEVPPFHLIKNQHYLPGLRGRDEATPSRNRRDHQQSGCTDI